MIFQHFQGPVRTMQSITITLADLRKPSNRLDREQCDSGLLCWNILSQKLIIPGNLHCATGMKVRCFNMTWVFIDPRDNSAGFDHEVNASVSCSCRSDTLSELSRQHHKFSDSHRCTQIALRKGYTLIDTYTNEYAALFRITSTEKRDCISIIHSFPHSFPHFEF